ncbi:hypothetical protein [Leptospira licerasiae]|uniref:hypothetical protein n=1 Tax=Leptospira licerasiae TaxID=447106 RepID=UPI00301B3C06
MAKKFSKKQAKFERILSRKNEVNIGIGAVYLSITLDKNNVSYKDVKAKYQKYTPINLDGTKCVAKIEKSKLNIFILFHKYYAGFGLPSDSDTFFQNFRRKLLDDLKAHEIHIQESATLEVKSIELFRIFNLSEGPISQFDIFTKFITALDKAYDNLYLEKRISKFDMSLRKLELKDDALNWIKGFGKDNLVYFSIKIEKGHRLFHYLFKDLPIFEELSEDYLRWIIEDNLVWLLSPSEDVG